MRSLLYTLFTGSLLLFGLIACQDHMAAPNVAPNGQRYQLKTMTYTGNQADSRTFSYNAANQLIGIQTIVPGSFPLVINQTNTYNGGGKITEERAVLLDASGQDLGGRKVFGYDGAGRINRVTLYNIFPPPVYAYQVYMVYSDSLRYDNAGRVARIDRKVYDQPVRGNNFQIGNAIITIDYDSQDNPVIITNEEASLIFPGTVSRNRTVYEYDDKPNALAGVDFPSIRAYTPYTPYAYSLSLLMKHNPVSISVYEPQPGSNSLTNAVLAQRLSAVYEYGNGLPVKVSWTGNRSNYSFDPNFTYTFSYNFY